MSARKPVINIDTPAKFIQAIPYLLGYHPSDRLVAVGQHGDDITFGASMLLHDVEEAFAQTMAAMRHHCQIVVLVGFGSAEAVTPAIDAARHQLENVGLTCVEAVRVTDGRYWSYTCPHPSADCCPLEGTPVDMAASAIACAFTSAGSVALPSRDDVAALLAPVSGSERDAMDQAERQARTYMAQRFGDPVPVEAPEFIAAGTILLDHVLDRAEDAFPTPGHIARLGHYLTCDTVLDHAYFRTDTDPGAMLPLWVWITRHLTQQRHLTAGLTAFCAWRRNYGALCHVALELSYRDEPEPRTNSWAQLVGILQRSAIPPQAIPRVPPRKE